MSLSSVSILKKYFMDIRKYFTNRSHDNFDGDLLGNLQADFDLISGRRALKADDLFLDPEFSYFILQASFGDKWCILSFLYEFLSVQKNAKILACERDRELIRIFVGDNKLHDSIIFIDENIINTISSYITPVSATTDSVWINPSVLAQTSSIILNGFPKNYVRHLHFVKYPYLTDLHLIHGLTYATCVRMMLALPNNSAPIQPKFYTEQDRSEAKNILDNIRNKLAGEIVLFNIHNISHPAFSEHQLLQIIKKFEFYNIQVIVNTAGHPDPDAVQNVLDSTKFAAKTNIPGHLLGLISEASAGVLGIIGGAMNVAVQFSSSHVLSFYTQGVGFDFPLNKLFGGYYSENIWLLYDKDWPCFLEGRVIQFIDFSGLDILTDEYLDSCIEGFIKSAIVSESKKLVD